MPQSARLLPLIAFLIGAGAGICWGMLDRPYGVERGRVHLEASVPRAVCGGGAGALVGGVLLIVCRRRPELATPVTLAVTPFLGAALAAPLGWMVGEGNPERSGPVGMAIGAALGGVVGLLLGAGQIARDREQADEAVRDDYAEPGEGSPRPTGESRGSSDLPHLRRGVGTDHQPGG